MRDLIANTINKRNLKQIQTQSIIWTSELKCVKQAETTDWKEKPKKQ